MSRSNSTGSKHRNHHTIFEHITPTDSATLRNGPSNSAALQSLNNHLAALQGDRDAALRRGGNATLHSAQGVDVCSEFDGTHMATSSFRYTVEWFFELGRIVECSNSIILLHCRVITTAARRGGIAALQPTQVAEFL